MEKNYNHLQTWIENLQANGKYTFTYEQACAQFKNISQAALRSSLNRLSGKNKIASIFKGFYVIITPEYSIKGMIPPLLFIDSLMKYINKPYYIGLLSAAAMHSASHQKPQEFFIINQLPPIRPTNKKGIKINYIGRINIPLNLLEDRKTEAGYVKVSNPELTAIDLLEYVNHIGGLNRAATIINELSEVMKPVNFTDEIISLTPVVILQRLGFILDSIIGNKSLADKIYKTMKSRYQKIVRRPLKAGKYIKGCPTDSKWKVIINSEIEIDE